MKLKYKGTQTLETRYATIRPGDIITDERLKSLEKNPLFEKVEKEVEKKVNKLKK